MKFTQRQVEINPYAKKRNKVLLISLIVLSLIGLSVSTILYIRNKEEPLKGRIEVCNLSQEETIETFKDHSFNDKATIKDFFFYGESLSLFTEQYDINKRDPLIGKTLLLTNLCTGDNYHYLIDFDVDGQIPLENLPDGLYEVFINIDMVKKRVVMENDFSESINLVSRGDQHRNVEVIGDKKIFDDKENVNYLDDNYLFLNVRSLENKADDYDIVLDPAYGENNSGWFDNYGQTFLGMVEADELYNMATIIKRDLEAAGLKVLITRDSKDHIINSYGESGRFHNAYNSKAKYYIELAFNDKVDGGLRVSKSSYASQAFAYNMADYLLRNTDLNEYGSRSVVSSLRYSNLDGLISVREMGGKALSAATFSDLAKDANGSFAHLNPHGLETIIIEYVSYKNQEEIEMFKNNKELYAHKTAEALLEYLKLGEVEVNDISD